MTSFLDANSMKKFILKLVIPATDDTPEQIRRVKLPRIVDHQGQVSYEELVGLVLTFHPSLDDDNEDINNDGQMSLASMTSTRSVVKKVVQFDYQDADGDKVTIASTEELVDALEQFSDQGTLRIATRIVTNTKTPPPFATTVTGLSGSHIGGGAARSVCSVGTTTSTIQTNRSASNAAAAAAPHNNNNSSRSNSSKSSMVNTVVGALANVVVSLEEGMNQKHQQSFVAQESKSEPSKAVESDEKPTTQAETTSGKKEEEAETKDEQGTDATSPPSNPRPFIHGRHTCDSCLVSPIVGKRYHATNLPDYDVCEVCFENYQGEDIKFEAVQHERDVAFQDRWNRKRERVEANMVRFVRRCGGDGGGLGRRGGPGGGHRGGWGRGGGGPGGCLGPRWHRHHGQPPHGVPPTSCANPPVHDFDHALTEAIRRSLEDVGPKPGDEVMADVDKVVEVETTPTASVPEAPMEEDIVVPPVAPAVIQTSAPTNTDNGELKSNLKPAPVVEEDDVGIVGVVTEAMGALDMVADVIEEMMQDAHATFQDAMEVNATTAAKDEMSDVVESNSPGLNEWQIVAEDEDDSAVIQPTVSIVTEEQRQRWFAQLSQLREIGFYDEGQCVETLERLHAANIGSDVSDEEISVTRVVNEILKQQE